MDDAGKRGGCKTEPHGVYWRMVRIAVQVLLFLWELPQNLAGVIVLLAVMLKKRVKHIEFDRNRCFIQSDVGVSLGWFVFWTLGRESGSFALPAYNREHEFGHSIQSRLLGPLYLPVVGVPSALRALYARRYRKKRKSAWTRYYLGFPENWADTLGNVDSTKESGLSRQSSTTAP